MSEAKHTPGPWVAEYNEHGGYDMMWPAVDVKLAGSTNSIVALEYGRNPSPKMIERVWADARLIAAAPAMFEALADLLSESDGWDETQLRKRYDEPSVVRILRARAALSQAQPQPSDEVARSMTGNVLNAESGE